LNGVTGGYAFRLNQTSVTDLNAGESVAGTLAASGYAHLFRIHLPFSQALSIDLVNDSQINRNEMYVQFGKPPTRAEYDYRFESPGAAHRIIVPSATQGDWY